MSTPADATFVRADIEDRAAFARLLASSIPNDWLPESMADALALFLKWLGAAPDCVG